MFIGDEANYNRQSDWICADRFVWRHVLSTPPHNHVSVCPSLSTSVTVCLYLSISVHRVCARVCSGTSRFTGHPSSCRGFSVCVSVSLRLFLRLSVCLFLCTRVRVTMKKLIRSTNVTTGQCRSLRRQLDQNSAKAGWLTARVTAAAAAMATAWRLNGVTTSELLASLVQH